MRLRNGFLINSSPKSLGMPLSNELHENSFKEFMLQANKDYVFIFKGETRAGNMIYSCGVPVKASFDQNRMFELSYKSEVTSCIVELNTITTNTKGEAERTTIEIFSNRIKKNIDSKCIDAFKKNRLY
jgi:hypothetical protein